NVAEVADHAGRAVGQADPEYPPLVVLGIAGVQALADEFVADERLAGLERVAEHLQRHRRGVRPPQLGEHRPEPASDHVLREAAEGAGGFGIGVHDAHVGVEHIDADRGSVDEAAHQRGMVAQAVVHGPPGATPRPRDRYRPAPGGRMSKLRQDGPGPAGRARPGRRDSRRALPTTETELRLMARAASIGLSSRPKAGYSRPAATGTPMAL